jgi:thiol-disulfide isomerase/thioredoxin
MKQLRFRRAPGARRADPYRDVDVIDAHAPRFAQATLALLLLVAFATRWWPLVAVLAAQWAIGLVFGRRYCVPCLVYFEVVQPLIGEGPIEDARPPRFANLLGALVMGVATVLFVAGVDVVGWALALLVASLALLAAATGVCVGCEVYRLGARLRGIRSHRLEHIDLADLDARPEGEIVVEFTHPLCTDCRALEDKLEAEGRRVVTVDVSAQPELARKYGVALVPTAVAVTPAGRVTARLAG